MGAERAAREHMASLFERTWVGLLNGDAEVRGSGYLRQPAKWAVNVDDGLVATQAAAITFPITSVAWGDYDRVGVFDASSGGALMFTLAVPKKRNVQDSMQVRFPAGALVYSAFLPVN